jgi:hypothetical protein
MTATALKSFMFFMGKVEPVLEPLPFSLGWTGLFHVTKAAITFFSGFEVTLQTSFFSGTTERIVYLFHHPRNASRGSNNRGFSQRLPARRHCRHAFRCIFAINMTNRTVDRVFFMCEVRKSKIGLTFIARPPGQTASKQYPGTEQQ